MKGGQTLFTVKNSGSEYAINHVKSASINSSISDIPQLDMVVINSQGNPGYQYLNEESIVVVDGQEWRIKVEVERPNYKSITALHTFMDLEQQPYTYYFENRTVSLITAINEVFSGTVFALDFKGSNFNINLKDFGRINKWEAFKEIIKIAEVEYILKPGNVVTVGKDLSVNNGRQFRYAHNLKNISKTTDSTKIVTHVIVHYNENLTSQATFQSANAASYSRSYYGPTITDERIKNLDEARERAAKEFHDINLSYELDVSTHENIYELGELIYTIYEPLDDLSIATRIRNIKEDWDGEKFNVTSVTVGNYVFQSADDMIYDTIDDKVEEEKERTDKEIAKGLRIAFSDSKRYTDAQIGDVTQELNSEIIITAERLTSEFEAKTTAIDGEITTIRNDVSNVTQTAESIQSTVASQQITIDNQSGRITNIQNDVSNVTQQANQIQSTVSSQQTTINNQSGEITNIKSDVSSITQQANQIESTVSSQQTTINSQGSRITSAESRITQNANNISLKVSETDYNGNTIISKINLSATTATIQAQRINLIGAVTVLSDITGNLGSITSGNINIAQDIRVGNNIWLNGTGTRGLYFDRFGSTGKITTNDTTMNVSSDNLNLNSSQKIGIYGTDIDMDAASITLSTGDDIAIKGFVGSATDNLYLAYTPGSSRLYLRHGGSSSGYNVGYITLTT